MFRLSDRKVRQLNHLRIQRDKYTKRIIFYWEFVAIGNDQEHHYFLEE